MKKGIIVQARMTSTRLPGKVMKKVGKKPLLEYQIERLLTCEDIHQVVVATTTNAEDDLIYNFCKGKGYSVFRGEEEDVLSRYYHAAKAFDIQLICRSTSDCPLIDPHIVNKVFDYYLTHTPNVEFVYSAGYPLGMSAEVFAFTHLEEAYQRAKKGYEREHVTPYFYAHPFKKFKVAKVTPETHHPDYRLTVDTAEDLKLIEKILSNLYPVKRFFSLKDIFALMEKHPKWKQINPHVQQKTLHE